MKKFVFSLLGLAFLCISFSSCSVQKSAQNNLLNSLVVAAKRAPQQTFSVNNAGLKVNVIPTPTAKQMDGYVHHLSGSMLFTNPTVKYVRSMGFKEMNPSTDFKLDFTVKQADVNGWDGRASMIVDVNVKNYSGDVVYSLNNISTSAANVLNITDGLIEAYTQVLEMIDWNRISVVMSEANLPQNQARKQVQGLGDTALEQMVIRWDVQSRPQGADLFWRVVSKTPEVKSTNNKYLMTTPYEATKTLDIMGLTYQTSGNVRIILRCEKEGYLPQEKEFDVRMIMDQEEISAFFRLVKE